MPVRFGLAILRWLPFEAGSLSFVFGEVIESRIHFFTFGTGENTPIHSYDHNGSVHLLDQRFTMAGTQDFQSRGGTQSLEFLLILLLRLRQTANQQDKKYRFHF